MNVTDHDVERLAIEIANRYGYGAGDDGATPLMRLGCGFSLQIDRGMIAINRVSITDRDALDLAATLVAHVLALAKIKDGR